MALYTPDELERIYFLPSAASVSAPTVANFTAGEDITDAIVSMSGFTFAANKTEVPNLGSRFTPSVSGRLTAEDSSIEFYKGDSATDLEEIVRVLLPRGADGYIARVHPKDGAQAAIAAATKVEMWPVEVMSNSIAPPVPGEAAKFTVQFSIPRQPNQSATIAA
ncbi:MAG TPA: hypothetical protein VHK88_20265 [Aquihabitans sp.]|jgi:hypothetical protein|nr:hypothetical protein [Aquihabitans sp.]